MISEKLTIALNEQLNFEFYSAHVYVQMAAYCTNEGYDGFANFFLVQAEEERSHAMKFYHYLSDRSVNISITGFELPSEEYTSFLQIFKTALKHEQEVTRRIYQLTDIAIEEHEHATTQFLKWFIEEQVEEEASFEKLIHKLKHISNEPSAIFKMDAELAKREI